MRPFFLALALVHVLAAQDIDAIVHGRGLYRSNCAFCHGLSGGGGRGPALARRQYLAMPSGAVMIAFALQQK